MSTNEISKKILFKPNPILEGIFKNNSGKDYYIFNSLLYIAQRQKVDSDYIAVISYNDMKDIINDKNIATVQKIKKYLDDNFRKETIQWKYNHIETVTGLITKIQFNEIDMSYYITIDKELVDYLINYNNKKIGYTPMDISKKSKNFYATRIYEYLRKWSGEKKEITVILIKFKEYLGIKNNYNDFRIFRRDLLLPAIKEIKNKYNMDITFETIKIRNSVQQIHFKFTDNEPRQYNFNNAIDVDFKEVVEDESIDDIQKLLREFNIGIAVSTTDKLKKQYGEELVIEGIKILHRKLLKEKIKAPVSYLKGIVDNLHKNRKQEKNKEQLKFCNFESRQYDYDSLENALLYGIEENQDIGELLRDLKQK